MNANAYLRGSPNYVWCTTSVLGKGATGAVYQGVDKNNGEPVAVKTFNTVSQFRPHDVQIREFEVLKKVKHENIVKLLAIEDEQDSRGRVIVMELCTGGSLFNILDDPENAYGLQEAEFLLVLDHLAAGIKHLRDNNLVHRDLKPGNIMKFIADDGSSIFKLTDFGAARELHEDQQFMSLYGTEEYLHPDMYERAVLKKPVTKSFGATVDLWSIGVTLYHVATGQLPFRPFGGRKNKETMHFITTKKASGVIFGQQTSDNGPIEWGRALPAHCQLTMGLQSLVTPLLAGLLEVDTTKMWSFERYFTEVTTILSRRIVHVFHVHRTQIVHIYLPPEGHLQELQQMIQVQTDVIPENQILLYQGKSLTSLVDEQTPSVNFPKTEPTDPLVLYSNENNNVILGEDPSNVPIKFPLFPSLLSVENDASIGKQSCSVAHACKRRIERLCLVSQLLHLSADQLTTKTIHDLEAILAKADRLRDLIACLKLTVSTIDKSESTIIELLHMLGNLPNIEPTADWFNEMSQFAKVFLSDIEPAIRQQHQRYVIDRELHREWTSASQGISCPFKSKAPARARVLVERIRDSWQHLIRDRAQRSLTYNDEQFHVLERIKVGENGRRIRQMLDSEVLPAVEHIVDSHADWYKMAQTVYQKARILDKDMDTCQRRLDSFQSRLTEESQKFYTQLERIKNQPKRYFNPSSSGRPSSTSTSSSTTLTASRNTANEASNKVLQEYVKQFLKVQREISVELEDKDKVIAKLMNLISINSASE